MAQCFYVGGQSAIIMYERELSVLRSKPGRRLVAEFLLFGGGVTILLLLFVEPALRSLFPGFFPNPSSPQRVLGSARMLPATRVGWAQAVAWATICGPFLYYRLYHTALGNAVITDISDAVE